MEMREQMGEVLRRLQTYHDNRGTGLKLVLNEKDDGATFEIAAVGHRCCSCAAPLGENVRSHSGDSAALAGKFLLHTTLCEQCGSQLPGHRPLGRAD